MKSRKNCSHKSSTDFTVVIEEHYWLTDENNLIVTYIVQISNEYYHFKALRTAIDSLQFKVNLIITCIINLK